MRTQTDPYPSFPPPAIRSRGHLLGYLFALTIILTLPWISFHLHLLTPESKYAFLNLSRNRNAGDFPLVTRQIFESDKDIDIFFVGSSGIMMDIDSNIVQDALSRHLGRPAIVVKAGTLGPSRDFPYFILKDTLARRKVRLVVTSMNELNEDTLNLPHWTSSYWFRYPEASGDIAGLGPLFKLELFALSVAGAPGNLLASLMPRPYQESHAKFGIVFVAHDGDGSSFQHTDTTPPSIAAEEMIYDSHGSHGASFEFDRSPIPPYQWYFAKKMVEITNTHSASMAILSVPKLKERQFNQVHEAQNWSNVFDPPPKLLGVNSQRLFRGLSDSEIRKLFTDSWHLNQNGTRYFSQAILSGLMEVYDEAANSPIP